MTQSPPVQFTADALAGVLADAMETMAFVCPLPPEGDAATAPPPPEALRVAMPLHRAVDGAPTARLELVAGEGFGRLLAANIIGDPGQTPSSAEAQDAMRELLNVTAGNLIRALAGQPSAAKLLMRIPDVEPFDAPAAWSSFTASAGSIVLDCEGHTVAARLIAA